MLVLSQNYLSMLASSSNSNAFAMRIMRIIHHFIASHALFLLILLALAPAEAAASAATEKEILLQFKANITDDPYNSLSSWLPSGNPCVDFSGVSCNQGGFVDKIVLWNTSLSGQLSASLSGLSFIRVLNLFGNRFSGNIPHEFSQLQTLWKINMSSNALSGSIPGFLGDLSDIRFLDLSNNGYSGEIPFALFKNCYRTKYVSISYNRLSGSIPRSMVNCSKLEGFDFSFNHLTGEFPSGICDIPVLKSVSVRSNALTGSVFREMSKCRSLAYLDLSRNSFTGLAPVSVLGFKSITYFNVSHNGFFGEIPSIGACGETVEFIDASWNSLVGVIPTSISNCKSLRVLDLGFNRLNGTIPVSISDLGKLLAISLANNTLTGTIPAGFGSNELLQVLDLHNLNLTGGIPADVCNCRFLRELDASGNALEGHIPDTIYNMSHMEILDLHGNRLNGSIPSSMGNLSQLRSLDLSENSLSGSIPSSLANLSMLTRFNLSYNNLSGIVPAIRTIQSFGASAFSNNPRLCGFPLTSCSLSAGRARVLSVSAVVAIVAAAVILTAVCAVTALSMTARRSRREDVTEVDESTPPGSSSSNVVIGKLVLFSKSIPSTYEDWETGTKALLDKDSLIGGGSIGTVYRTSFEDGNSVAVKKLETLGRMRDQDDFEQEFGRLGNIKHPNLVALQGYYWSSSTQLILSEFIPNVTLYDYLHGPKYQGTESSWSRRFNIVLGTARALSFLHHDCTPPILHLNIKSKNILLDEKFEARLSDYGLCKLLPLLDDHGSTRIHNVVGYVAPELAQSLVASEKCDVYSFGIILLETVTGKKPVESPTVNQVVILCKHVRRFLQGGSASGCFDRRLVGFAENELIQIVKLGLICTAEDPTGRPSMSEVVQVLESIRSETES